MVGSIFWRFKCYDKFSIFIQPWLDPFSGDSSLLTNFRISSNHGWIIFWKDSSVLTTFQNSSNHGWINNTIFSHVGFRTFSQMVGRNDGWQDVHYLGFLALSLIFVGFIYFCHRIMCDDVSCDHLWTVTYNYHAVVWWLICIEPVITSSETKASNHRLLIPGQVITDSDIGVNDQQLSYKVILSVT